MRKINIALYAAICTVSLLSGCGEKKTISITDEIVESGSVIDVPVITVPQENTDEQAYESLDIEEMVEFKNSEGRALTVDVNLHFSVDESEEIFTLTSFEELTFDEAIKEKIVNAYFGDAVVYSGDEDDLTTSELQSYIDWYEEQLTFEMDKEDKEYYQGLIDKYKGYQTSSDDNRKSITDYNHDIFLGKIEGIEEECMVAFDTVQADNDERLRVYIGAACTRPYAPNYKRIKYDAYSDTLAENIINEFMDRAGLLPVKVISDAQDHRKVIRFEGDSDNTWYKCYAGLINGKIATLDIIRPRTNYDKIENVDHISLSEVKEIIMNVINLNAEKYFMFSDNGKAAIYNIRRDYKELKNGDKTYLTPVWIVQEQLMINAITGDYYKIGLEL